jgi:spore coat protein U-like protein
MLSSTQRKYVALTSVLPFIAWMSTTNVLAGMVSTTMQVTLGVNNTCQVQLVGGPLAFGVYSIAQVQAGGISATSSISVTCSGVVNTTPAIAYTVDISNGLYAGATYKRYLKTSSSSTYAIPYEIYRGSNDTSAPWYDGTSSTVNVAGTGNGSPQTIPIYGLLGTPPSGLAEGDYSDTVTVSVNW